MVYMYMSGQETKQTKPPRIRTELASLLALRRAIKARTPNFQRQESWRYVRIHDAWRKPKGIDSHMRLSVKGWPPLVKVGYRVPKEVRGLHPSGYRDVLIHNLSELEALIPNRDAARLAAGLGRRKRIEIAKRAREKGIRVLNGRMLIFAEKAENEKEEKEKPEEVKEEKKQAKKPSKNTKTKKKSSTSSRKKKSEKK
jgi:large subunit ribosomal protein L32e